MPLIRAWRRLSPIGQVALVAIATLLIVASFTLGFAAYGRAGGVAGCLNRTLGARNQTGLAQLAATDRFSANLANYLDHALKLKGRNAQLAAFQQISQHTDEWHQAVHAARVSAAEHPLGRC